MKGIIVFLMVLFFYSCGTTKKATQIETHSKVNFQTSFLDTSKRSASWEVFVNSVVKEIDLSKIQITTYYHDLDSTGKQLIKEFISIDKNSEITVSIFGKETKNENEKKDIGLKSRIIEESETKLKIKENKTSSKLINKVLICVLLLFIGIIIGYKITNK